MAVVEPIQNTQLLVDVVGASHALGIGRTQLFDLIRNGELETVTIGRRRLIPRVALEEYVERLRARQSERAT